LSESLTVPPSLIANDGFVLSVWTIKELKTKCEMEQ